MQKYKEKTICWECKKALGKCNWSKNFQPVEGWEIIPTQIQVQNGLMQDSCIVLSCPLFERG